MDDGHKVMGKALADLVSWAKKAEARLVISYLIPVKNVETIQLKL